MMGQNDPRHSLHVQGQSADEVVDLEQNVKGEENLFSKPDQQVCAVMHSLLTDKDW